MSKPSPLLLSFAGPVFNEEANLPQFYVLLMGQQVLPEDSSNEASAGCEI